MNKKELRKIYKEKRTALSEIEKMKLDDLLLIQLQRVPLNYSVQYLMSYWPLDHQGEPNTHLFERYLQHAIPALQIAYPVSDFSTGEMYAIVVNEETRFKDNHLAIAEPETGEKITPDDLDIIFVPLLAFDNNGYRVGYGKGFYDRFLQKCSENIITIGFSYFEPVSNINDKNQFDVPLNFCITPYKVYEF